MKKIITQLNIFLLIITFLSIISINYLDHIDRAIPVVASNGNINPTYNCTTDTYNGATSPYTAADIILTTNTNVQLNLYPGNFDSSITPSLPSRTVVTGGCAQTLPTAGDLTDTTPLTQSDLSLQNGLNITNATIYTPERDFVGTVCFDVFLEISGSPTNFTNVITIKIQVGGSTSTICPPIPKCTNKQNAAITNQSSDAVTASSICINSGVLSLYSGDTTSDNDVCSNEDIAQTTQFPLTPVVQEGVTCSPTQNSVSLGTISTTPVRQQPTSVINDVIFDDLRGLPSSTYTVTAEISDFVDSNNSNNKIVLGANPDNQSQELDKGIVTSINMTNGGSGYDTPPVVTIYGGGGSGANAIAVVSGGVVTKIDVKSYGTGYTSAPTIIITPISNGSGATATSNIIEKDSNLNPQTSNPESSIFVILDPSVGIISALKPIATSNPIGISTGPRKLVTSATTQQTLITTSVPVAPGRYDLDGIQFGLRVPAYLSTGNYKSTITQTIITG
jgi:hypothetical protein